MLSTTMPWGYVAAYLAIAAAFVAAALFAPRANAAPHGPAHIAGFDGLRGLAALAVFFHHFSIANDHLASGQWRAPLDHLFANFGPVAVTLFFFITAVLFYRRAPGLRGPLQWVRLLLSRLFRLVPLYLLVIALVALATFAGTGFAARTGLGENLTALLEWLSFGFTGPGYFNGDAESHYAIARADWTLRYEWAFYLVLPLLGLFARLLRPRLARMAVLAGLYGGLMLSPVLTIGWFATDVGAVFLLGMLAVEISEIPAIARLLQGRLGAGIFLVAISTALSLQVLAYAPGQQLACWVAFLPVACGQTAAGLLVQPVLRRLGTISYSIYLLHGLVLFAGLRALAAIGWLQDSPWSWLWLPVLAIPLILLSRVTYRTIEAPGMALGRRLAGRLDARHVPAELIPVRT